MKKIKCFTLAEVLITLTILGVVAAIIIPSTVKRVTDKQTVTAVKKAYSTISTALDIAIAENGPLSTWYIDNNNYQDNRQRLENNIMKYIRYKKICTWGSREKECNFDGKTNLYGVDTMKRLDGGNYNIQWKTFGDYALNNVYILNDESWLGIGPKESANNGDTWGYIYVDINGKKAPNRLGFDTFVFFNRNLSNGLNFKPNTISTNSENCNIKSTTNGRNGVSCSYWVIKHGNLDYKYRDVSSEW